MLWPRPESAAGLTRRIREQVAISASRSAAVGSSGGSVGTMATLKNWRLLRKLRWTTNRITDIVKAVLVLHHASA
jgi:hypothetical protein